MKFSETPPPLRDARIKNINLRWKQLYDLITDSGNAALQYLFLINAGGAATTLAFIGAVGAGKIGSGAKASLAVFIVGVILLGFGKAKTVHKLARHFQHWRSSVGDYFSDRIDYEDLLRADNQRSGQDFFDYAFPYGSFVCFIIGSAIGFSSLI